MFLLGNKLYFFLQEGVAGENIFYTLSNHQISFFLSFYPTGFPFISKAMRVVSVPQGSVGRGINPKSLLQSAGNAFRQKCTSERLLVVFPKQNEVPKKAQE